MSLPQAAVTLVCHSEDVGRQLPHLVFAVQSNCTGIIKACDLFIWIDCCQDRPNVCLRAKKRQKKKHRGISDNASANTLDSEHTCDLVLVQILFILAGNILGTISSVWVMRFGEN